MSTLKYEDIQIRSKEDELYHYISGEFSFSVNYRIPVTRGPIPAAVDREIEEYIRCLAADKMFCELRKQAAEAFRLAHDLVRQSFPRNMSGMTELADAFAPLLNAGQEWLKKPEDPT